MVGSHEKASFTSPAGGSTTAQATLLLRSAVHPHVMAEASPLTRCRQPVTDDDRDVALWLEDCLMVFQTPWDYIIV